MTKKNRLLPIVSLVISVVSIIASFSYIGYDKILSVDWDILGWISLAVAIFTILSVIITSLLMMQRHRILRIYLSAPVSYEDEVSKLKDALAGENIISSDNLKPGTSVDDLRKEIMKSHCCFFAVGKNQSPMQKEELKIMKTLGKNIYIVSVDDRGIVPQTLRGEVPLYANDDDFKKKVKDIVLEYK